jgi:hypothetical protein
MTTDTAQAEALTVQMGLARRPVSISQLQRWHRCGYAWHLKYERGYIPRLGAGAWFGKVMHEIIGLMYRGLRMADALERVWRRECGPVFDDLQRLVVLDAAYAACGRPATNTAKRWRAEHPEYDEVLARIADGQEHALGSYRWGATQHLADYYRRAIALQDSEGEILLAEPLLVEGIPVSELRHPDDEVETLETEGTAADATEEASAEFDEDGRGTRYRLLAGEIAGVPVVGVPDVLARAADGALLVADYKTGRPLGQSEIAQSAQLVLYVGLLRQQGYIGESDRVRIGHLYLTETGVLPVWTDTRDQERALARLARQLSLAAALMENGLLSDRKGLDTFLSPCTSCDLAHVCDA